MTSATRKEHLKDTADLYADDCERRHCRPFPMSSRAALWTAILLRRSSILFEGFVKKIVDAVKSQHDALGQHGYHDHLRRRRRIL